MTRPQGGSAISRDCKERASPEPRKWLLGAVATAVRSQWPLARILIIGRAATMLEDQLYDEQVERSTEPGQLLDDLERLYKDSWTQRSDTIAWKGPLVCMFGSPADSRKRPHQGFDSRGIRQHEPPEHAIWHHVATKVNT